MPWARARELVLAAKVYCSEAAVKACTDAINAVGMYSRTSIPLIRRIC